jgi:hypothetical protein
MSNLIVILPSRAWPEALMLILILQKPNRLMPKVRTENIQNKSQNLGIINPSIGK